ncbi:MAG TPA: OmpA family protein [Balneolales bacterium]|nr:OmpA family protein [Balneolales bacterium]
MKRTFNFLLIAMLLFGGLTVQMACKSSKETTKQNIDTDGDGLTDAQEIKLGTNPNKADTDGDGLTDGQEVNKYKTNPLVADTDGDGLNDGDEVLTYKTDPLKKDTDGDGLTDGDEVLKYHTNPLKKDSDGDGLTDAQEVNQYKTDPNKADTDGDGFTDGQEIQMGTNPNDANDPVFIKQLNTIHFDFDKSNIDDQAAQQLTENVKKLQENPKFRVRVDAYTDHVGGDQYNLRLSKRRANAVFKFYTDNGISGDRIDARGLGKAPVPCAHMDTQGKGCRANRRAESHPINPYKYQPNN